MALKQLKHLIVRIMPHYLSWMQDPSVLPCLLLLWKYTYRNRIASSRGLHNIMNIGNEFYTSLSRLSKQNLFPTE